jgi:hypothetical protein
MKLSLIIASIAVALLFGGQAGLVLQERPNSAPTLTIAFVGNDNVDLTWNPVDCEGYRIKRDGGALSSPTIETISGFRFFRDTAVSDGETHTYQVCALYNSGLIEECSDVQNVHVGWVTGSLYKDLVWSTGVVNLFGNITIENGAILHIGGSTLVTKYDADIYSITAYPGALVVEGSSVTKPRLEFVDLNIDTGNSAISYADLRDIDSLNLSVSLNLHHNQLARVILFQSTGVLTFEQNTMEESMVRLAGQADGKFNHNTFYGGESVPATIRLREQSTATISENTFNSGLFNAIIDVGGKQATITKNTFNGGTIRVGTHSGSAVDIIENTMTAGLIESRDYPFSDPPSSSGAPSQLIIQKNLLLRSSLTFYPGVQFAVEDCTITYGSGIYINNASGWVHGSCIAGNQYGINLNSNSSDISATNNYWGNWYGPLFADNPSHIYFGDSVVISGTAHLDYQPYLQYSNCDETTVNLKIAHIEAVQVVQNMSNSLTLVEDKPTIVRVYVASGPMQVHHISARLTVLRGATVLGELEPDAPHGASVFLRSDGTHALLPEMRKYKDNSLEFRLPLDWQQRTLTLNAEVNPDQTIVENNYSDNHRTITATFQVPAAGLNVGLVPVNSSGGSIPEEIQAGGMVSPATLLDSLALFRKIYPSSNVEPFLLPPLNWSHNPYSTIGLNLYDQRLLNQLRVRYLLQQAYNPGALDQIQAVFPAGTFAYGKAEPNSKGGLGRVGYETASEVSIGRNAVENLGLTITGGTAVGEYGYDIQAGVVITPGMIDITNMAYSIYPPDRYKYWISPANYQYLLSHYPSLSSEPGPSTAPTPAQTYAITSAVMYKEWVYGQGIVTKISFEPVWQVTTGTPPQNPPGGSDYCLELRDAAETVLSGYCFNQPGLTSSVEDSFTVSLPLVGTPVRLSLRTGPALVVTGQPEAEIGSVTVSAHPPQVTLQYPTGGETLGSSVQVQWSGSDADLGTQLTYNLLYSADGVTWMPVATGITLTQYTLDLGLIPGSTSARIRVIASDGYHTASDDSNGSFTVSNKAPMVSILSPSGFTIIPSGAINLTGSAYDADDGLLDGTSLVWSSNRDGVLGTGTNLEAIHLSPGSHVITLTATDSGAQAGSASVLVFSGTAKLVYLPFVRK